MMRTQLSQSQRQQQASIPAKAEQLQQDSLKRLQKVTSQPSDQSAKREEAETVERLSREAVA